MWPVRITEVTKDMKKKMLLLAGTVLMCGAWAVAQAGSAGAGHSGGSMGTSGQSTTGTQTHQAADDAWLSYAAVFH